MLAGLSLLETGLNFLNFVDDQESLYFIDVVAFVSKDNAGAFVKFSDIDIIILSLPVDCTKALFVHCEVT